MKERANIFTPSGCLSQDGLSRLAFDRLNGADRQAALDHCENCELCSEALEGVKIMHGGTQYNADLEDLHSAYFSGRTFRSRLTKSRAAIVFMAATLLVMVSIASLFRYRSMSRNEILAALPEELEIDEIINSREIVVRQATSGEPKELSEDINQRRQFGQDFGIEEERTTPLAQFSSTVVRVSDEPSLPEIEVEEVDEVLTRRSAAIRYPFRVMNHAPATLHLAMPEEGEASEDVFFRIEDLPRFNGKDYSAFLEFIHSKLEYPEKAIDYRISGRVYVQFTINKNGEIAHPQVIRGVHRLLDNEVLRVVQLSPVWEPGRQRGHAVDVSLILPVDFILE